MESALTEEQIQAIVVAALKQSARPMPKKELEKIIEHAEGARMDWMLWELVIDGKLQPSLDGDDIAFSAPK